jgi:hypothetical protein
MKEWATTIAVACVFATVFQARANSIIGQVWKCLLARAITYNGQLDLVQLVANFASLLCVTPSNNLQVGSSSLNVAVISVPS